MVSIRSVGTALTALTLAVSLPVSAASASVRPGSAVPTATAAATTTSAGTSYGARAASLWPFYAALGLALAYGLWIEFSDKDGDFDLGICPTSGTLSTSAISSCFSASRG